MILAALVLLDIGDLEHGLAAGDRCRGRPPDRPSQRRTASDPAPRWPRHRHRSSSCSSSSSHDEPAPCPRTRVLVIAHKLGGGHILAELNAGPAQIAQSLAGLPGALTLLLHQLLEGRPDPRSCPPPPAISSGQVDGEAVGIVELEGVGAGEDRSRPWPCVPPASRRRSSCRRRWSWRSSPPRCWMTLVI